VDETQCLTEECDTQVAERLAVPSAEEASREDARCLALIASGNEEAVSQLYDRHSARVYGAALFLVRDPADAEDVVIDAFMQVWRTAAEYDARRGTVSAWLTTIVRSRALDVVRARGRRERAHEMAGMQSAIENDEGSSWAGELFQSLRVDDLKSGLAHALSRLSAAQRAVIELTFLAEMPHTRVAAQLGLPLGTVKTRARLALRNMRKTLEASSQR
jgi:RNA polymerase sigma-70 factor, ECF subfamily